MSHKIDATGLVCPMPLLRLKQAIRKGSDLNEIVIFVSDKASVTDIPKWSIKQGYRVVINELDDSSHTQITISL